MAATNKTIGVLGGMGAMATALFYTILTSTQPVHTEQETPDIIIYSKTSTPDRSAFILGQSKLDPTLDLVAAATALERAGAGFIAIPCVTAHYFYDYIASAVGIPVINLLDEIAQHIQTRYKKIGLLATDGTLQARILHNMLEPHGIDVVAPDIQQQQLLMDMIYRIKQGRTVSSEDFDKLKDTVAAKGAEAVLLGCTELSLIKSGNVTACVDALKVLAQATIDKWSSI